MSRYFARLAQRTGLAVAQTQTPPATAAPSSDIVQQDMYVDAPPVNAEVSAAPSQSLPTASKVSLTSVSSEAHSAPAVAMTSRQHSAENQPAAPSILDTSRAAAPAVMDVFGPNRIAPEHAALSTHTSTIATLASQVDSHSTNHAMSVVPQDGVVLLENLFTRKHVPSAPIPERSNTRSTGVAGEPGVRRASSAPMSETVVNDKSRPFVSVATQPTENRPVVTPESPPANRKPAFNEHPTSTTVWPSDSSRGNTASASSKPAAMTTGVDVRIGSVRLEIHSAPVAAPLVAPASAPAAPRESPRFAARRHYLRG